MDGYHARVFNGGLYHALRRAVFNRDLLSLDAVHHRHPLAANQQAGPARLNIDLVPAFNQCRFGIMRPVEGYAWGYEPSGLFADDVFGIDDVTLLQCADVAAFRSQMLGAYSVAFVQLFGQDQHILE